MEHHPDTCADVLAALPLYVGADLEAGEQTEVREHLARCPACRAEASRAQEARDVLRSLRAAQDREPAPDLWPGVRAAIRAGRPVERAAGLAVVQGQRTPRVESPAERPAARSRRRARSLRLGLGSFAAAAALVLVAWVGGPAGGGTLPAGVGPVEDGALVQGPVAPGGTVLRTHSASSPVAGVARPAVADAQDGRLRRAGTDEPHMLDAAHEVLVVLPALPLPEAGTENVLTGDH